MQQTDSAASQQTDSAASHDAECATRFGYTFWRQHVRRPGLRNVSASRPTGETSISYTGSTGCRLDIQIYHSRLDPRQNWCELPDILPNRPDDMCLSISNLAEFCSALPSGMPRRSLKAHLQTSPQDRPVAQQWWEFNALCITLPWCEGSNLLVALLVQAATVLERTGITDSSTVLGATMRADLDNAPITGSAGATGSAVRGDTGQIAEHLSALELTALRMHSAS